MNKTASGLDENVAGALCYALGWVTGVVFLLTEPSNRFVRFHAWQSTIVFGAACVARCWRFPIPLIGWVFASSSSIGPFLWLILMFKAYQGERFKLPVAGDMAEQRI